MEKFGVIGLGSISARHRRNIRLLFPQAQIIALPAHRETTALPSRIENVDVIASSISEMMQYKLQYIIIASPASLHKEHVIQCLKSGLPILVEKPLTNELEDGRALCELAKQSKSRVSVGYCLRYLPSVEVIKDLINNQSIGHIYNISIEVGEYLPNWRPDTDYRKSVSAQKKLGGGALLELSHEIDLATWIFGPLSLKHAILRSAPELETDVEDCADIIFLSKNEVVTYVHLDFLQRKPYRKWRIIGSLGSLEWDLIKNKVTFISEAEERTLYSAPNWNKNNMYLNQLEEFVSPLPLGKQKIASAEEGLASIQLIEQIKRYPIIKQEA